MVFGIPDPPPLRPSKYDTPAENAKLEEYVIPPDPRFPNQNQTSRWPGFLAAGLIGTLVGGAAAWYACTQSKEEERPQRHMPSTSSCTDTPTRSVQREELLCVVCLTHEREIILLPCGHVCICRNCSASMRTKLCPICRKSIETRKPAYIS